MPVSIEKAIYNKLITLDVLPALYWRQAPAGSREPYVVMVLVDDPRTKRMLCYYGGEARIQFGVFDTDAGRGDETAMILVDNVRALRGLQDGLRIDAFVTNIVTLPNADEMFQRTVDVIVRYTEEA